MRSGRHSAGSDPFVPADWRDREPLSLMSPGQLRWLGRRWQPAYHSAGARLVVPGRPSNGVGVVLEGRLEIFVPTPQGLEQACARLTPGDFYGFSVLFCNGAAPYGIRTAAASRCLAFTSQTFFTLIERNAALKDYFYREAMARTGLVCRTFQGPEAPRARARDRGRTFSAAIQKAVAYIGSHYAEPITLQDVAAACGMSKYGLSRRFNAETGTSFKTYLNRIRVRAAKELLSQPSVNVSEACFAVGFNDLSYFSRVFRRIDGRSPSAYRKGFSFCRRTFARKSNFSTRK